jgi:hypothetical protein
LLYRCFVDGLKAGGAADNLLLAALARVVPAGMSWVSVYWLFAAVSVVMLDVRNGVEPEPVRVGHGVGAPGHRQPLDGWNQVGGGLHEVGRAGRAKELEGEGCISIAGDARDVVGLARWWKRWVAASIPIPG